MKDLSCASTRGAHRCYKRCATHGGVQKNGRVGEVQFLGIKRIASWGSFDQGLANPLRSWLIGMGR